MPIDHVLFAVRDPAAAARRLSAEHGLSGVPGGLHPAWGTGNWIVPLGSSYLELVHVVDPGLAARTPFGQRVSAVLRAGGGPFAWCVRPADFEATVRRLGLTAGEGSRRRPDGVTLAWRTAGLEVALGDPSRPFFIDWQVPPADHPGASAAGHGIAPAGIASVDLCGDGAVIRAWLGEEALPVTIRPGSPAVAGVEIGTADGPIHLAATAVR